MTPSTPTLTARVVSPAELSPAERAHWDALCAAPGPFRRAFLTFAYAAAVDRVRPGVRVAIVEAAGRPVGFFAFQFRGQWERLLGAGERLGEEMSDYFGVVMQPGIEVTPGQLLRVAGLNSFLFNHLDETQLGLGLTGEQPEPGLRIAFPDGGSKYWEALRARDKKFVGDTERRERKLEREVGPLAFVFDHAEPSTVLRDLISAKRGRYEKTEVGDALAAPWKRALLDHLGRVKDPLCTGVTSTLHAGDQWIAFHFGLRCHDTLHYWFPVYNEAFNAYGPGRLLLKSVILAADQTGLRLIDRGAGDTPSKRDFANETHQYYRGGWSRPTLSAVIVRARQSLLWRLQAAKATRKAS